MNHNGVTPDHRGALQQLLGQAAALTATASGLESAAADAKSIEDVNRHLNRRGRVLADARHALKMAEVHALAAQADAILDLVDVAREIRNLLAGAE